MMVAAVEPMAQTRLQQTFDSVVMLTFSNWPTEARSNRYHYATRFARHLPVIFVQADCPEAEFWFEPTEFPNVQILHIYKIYGTQQSNLLNQALCSIGKLKPFLWIYNFFFIDFILNHHSRVKIYHATEDYFSSAHRFSEEDLQQLKSVLSTVQLLIGVSPGVLESYTTTGCYDGKTCLVLNGCDYEFYAPPPEEIATILNRSQESAKIALFQGGIRRFVDFGLLNDVITQMPDWEFWFCGKVIDVKAQWDELLKLPNVKYWGYVQPEKIRELSYLATVGIIPYIQEDIITEVSMPLKAFEYLACGLPVVTVPIKALEPYAEFFHSADNASNFCQQIRAVALSRFHKEAIESRLAEAKKHAYDKKFEQVLNELKTIINAQEEEKNIPAYSTVSKPLNVLMLYDSQSMHVQTIVEYLESFAKYSQHNYIYAPATQGLECNIDLSFFDVVALHYSIRVCFDGHLSSHFEKALRCYGGHKVLFIQDDYDLTETTRKRIEDLGIHSVFTPVPQQFIDVIYPKQRFPFVTFKNVLTGFMPERLLNRKSLVPLRERPYHIVYRGRTLPYSYGSLSYEKYWIGKVMKGICIERGIPADIEVDDAKRIYGENWYYFLESGRATLGTETGSNLFDFDGQVTQTVKELMVAQPDLTFEDVYERWIKPYDNVIDMHELSPKVFEAICLKTALILFEGEYSGILKPHVHYIPLKKDFSNVDDILAKLDDFNYLERLTERAYEDIVLSGEYTYQRFVQTIDLYLNQHVFQPKGNQPIYGVIAYQSLAKQSSASGRSMAFYPSKSLFNASDLSSIREMNISQRLFETSLIRRLKREQLKLSQDLKKANEKIQRFERDFSSPLVYSTAKISNEIQRFSRRIKNCFKLKKG